MIGSSSTESTDKGFAEFEVSSKEGPRVGTLGLPGGAVPTPVFMPVGTQATVKGILPRD